MTEILHEHFDQARVYCMSKRWSNLQMWAKYAGDHTGYCLEFANIDVFRSAKEVRYSDSEELDATDPSNAHAGWFYLKRAEWSNEEEIRIVFPKLMGKCRARFAPEALTRVILGHRMSPDNRVRILKWARERVPSLQVVGAEYDKYKQELVLRNVK